MLKLTLSKLSFAVVNGPVKLLSRNALSLKTKFGTTASIQIEDSEERCLRDRYAVLWKAEDEENRYSARIVTT
jgi:hypothetical protein